MRLIASIALLAALALGTAATVSQLREQDLELTQAFHVHLPLAENPGMPTPVVVPVPAGTAGLAISCIRPERLTTTGLWLQVKVNGVTRAFQAIPIGGELRLHPPLIVAGGSTLELRWHDSPSHLAETDPDPYTIFQPVNVAGWTLN